MDLEVAEVETGGFDGLLDDAAGAGAELAGDEWDVVELGELDLFVGPVVANGDDADHVVFHEGFDVDVLAESGTFDEGDLGAVVGESFEDGLGVAAEDGDFYFWVFGEEGGDEAREQVLADGLGGGYGEGAGVAVGGGGYGLAALLGERGEFFGVGKQGGAGGGEREFAAGAVEEGGVEFGFEGFDLLGDRGLGEEEFLGGHAEVQVASGRAEDLEAEVFHLKQRTGSGWMLRVWAAGGSIAGVVASSAVCPGAQSCEFGFEFCDATVERRDG